ncbi:hypothetical protein [uncultured Bacteroides sp.]|uniref:hypothetical protein n=1 Tax=uncultured Bacteroides sp. TaxID=162156 RepID=UPI00260EC869|nr:hypothetical protein [uncultured Bacteroides sp.]
MDKFTREKIEGLGQKVDWRANKLRVKLCHDMIMSIYQGKVVLSSRTLVMVKKMHRCLKVIIWKHERRGRHHRF